MKNNKLIVAAIAGIMAITSPIGAFAEEGESKESNGCGENGCEGKNGCEGHSEEGASGEAAE